MFTHTPPHTNKIKRNGTTDYYNSFKSKRITGKYIQETSVQSSLGNEYKVNPINIKILTGHSPRGVGFYIRSLFIKSIHKTFTKENQTSNTKESGITTGKIVFSKSKTILCDRQKIGN